MASSSIQTQNIEYSTKGGSENYTFALTSLTSLFFMWGFITCLNDILIPHLKGVFDLSYSQAMLVQFCFFGAWLSKGHCFRFGHRSHWLFMFLSSGQHAQLSCFLDGIIYPCQWYYCIASIR